MRKMNVGMFDGPEPAKPGGRPFKLARKLWAVTELVLDWREAFWSLDEQKRGQARDAADVLRRRPEISA
jgi:hypothetical protein